MTRACIALVGLRASGKTSLAPRLARALGCEQLDLDREIEIEDAALRAVRETRRAGVILEREGEQRFRDLESRTLERLLARATPCVLATGGGVVERASNRLLLRTRATCVWLRVPIDELARRMAADPTPRPALLGNDPLAEIAGLAARREPLYRELLPREVECAGASLDLVLARTLAALAAGTENDQDGG